MTKGHYFLTESDAIAEKSLVISVFYQQSKKTRWDKMNEYLFLLLK